MTIMWTSIGRAWRPAGLVLSVVLVAGCDDGGGGTTTGDGSAIGDGANAGLDVPQMLTDAGAPTDAASADALPTGPVTIGVPREPGLWSGTPVEGGATAPAIVYPSDQTRFPRNIYRTLFQWRPQGATEFRLTFDGPGGEVTVFTDGLHASCLGKANAACWEADEMSWALIAGRNAGGTVTFTVDALEGSGANVVVRRSARITVGFSLRDVAGAIFYWSTTVAGIRRATVSAALPENYLAGKPPTTYDNPADQIKCVACHVVSRDGKFMAAPVEATSSKGLWILEVTKAAPPNPLIKTIANTGGHGFATIAPDNARVVAAWKGLMWMVDRVTGNKLGDLPLGALKGTHPDWSPDNTQLVFATGSGDSPGGTNLAVIPWDGAQWGVPRTLVPAAGKDGGNAFPMHSPDGKWIAFARGKGGHGDVTAQLHVVAAKGDAPVPIELINANRVVSNRMTDGKFQNSQPTWAPTGDFEWVAFNSKREYGVVSPAGRQQIWVAAIDPKKAEQGIDPSYPAFRLQFQGLDEDNHRAFWTLDVRDIKPTPVPVPQADGGMCVQPDQVCDPSIDTCCMAGQGFRCDTLDDGLTYRCLREIN